MKPYAESCDQNRQPILEVLRPLLTECARLLEIGSGTGQHAVFFAEQFPHLRWQTSDVAANHPGIHAWLAEGPANALAPLDIDVTRTDWPGLEVDAVFSANTVHIMGWPAVEALFNHLPSVLRRGGRFILYGPFNYHGQYTSESNARFDQWLKARDPQSAIRNFEDLDALARANGLFLEADNPMPANNRTLVWVRQ